MVRSCVPAGTVRPDYQIICTVPAHFEYWMDASAADGDNSGQRRSADMTEPTIVCPKCNNEIRLTESLAAPLIAATRRQFERQLSEKDADIARREQGVRERERQVLEGRRALDQQVQTQVEAQLKLERARV